MDQISSQHLGKLSIEEISLIYYIRNKYQFGEIIIENRSGKPWRIKQSVKFELLDGNIR